MIRSERQTVDLHRDDADLAIRYGLGDFPNLDGDASAARGDLPGLRAGPAQCRSAVARAGDLAAHDLLHDAGALGNEPWIRWQPWLDYWGLEGGRGRRRRAALHFTDSVQLYQAALLGQGVALGRSVLIGDELAAGRLVRPFAISRQSSYAYYAVSTKPARDNPRVAAFIAWLVAEMRPDSAAS